MGNAHIRWFANLPEVEIVALCDVDRNRLAETYQRLQKIHPNTKVDTYSDFRHILERKDIDAITCATPDHWHAQIACLAFEAGKDVYGEKPLSYDVYEGRKMLEYCRKYNRIFQMGNQIHAGENFHRVVELIRSGSIGTVNKVHLWKTGGAPNLGNPPPLPVPAALDWDMWLGPAPYTAYIPEKCHGTYRYFLDYSGGVFADFWCHIADIAFWALNPQGLKKISARGKAPDGIADAPEWIEVDYEYEDLDISWRPAPPKNYAGTEKMGIGAVFEGSNGILLCDYDKREIVINGEKLEDLASVAQTLPRSPGHQQNFVNAVKSRIQPESNLEYARQMTLPMHLGLISYRLERGLEWDAANEKFVNDRAANRLLRRKPRKKWDLL
ncbi:Gfo/Idh/MocA family oxidoreductase [Ravibacter arvi]|uniref:Gfo/Idh/MocA family oxidoreductase n=2 Tax=Ravibacter arvi TaxID=2051041 RepID=A0ABP8LSZ3_9BACT